MKAKILLLLIFTALVYSTKAQFSDQEDFTYEIGASIGAMNAFTDVGGNDGIGSRFLKDYNLKTTQLSGGVYFMVKYKNYIGLRLEGTLGSVKGYDSILPPNDQQERYLRNLSYYSKIAEVSLLAEFHPIEAFTENEPLVSPYLLAGVGFFHFNPQANLNGAWINLQPLSTEGQGFAEYPNRKVYSLNQLNIPLGIGAKYDLNDLINIKLEFQYRFLFTDYLDDVSTRYIDPVIFSKYYTGADLQNALLLNDRSKPGAQTAHIDGIRGSSKYNDAYFSFNLKIGFALGKYR